MPVAGQFYVSANTVQTHMRHLYQKLGARRRSEAVEQARALGLLASSARRPQVAGRLRRASSQDGGRGHRTLRATHGRGHLAWHPGDA